MNYQRVSETLRPVHSVAPKQYFAGLDLGQAQDFTALAIIERIKTGIDWQLNCLHLERFPLRTSYPAIVAQVCQRLAALTKINSPARIQTCLAVDATGVGAPVVDLFRQTRIDASLQPIQIVGGQNVSHEGGVTRVPKRDLVSCIQVGLQSKMLRIAPKLSEAETLARELQNFQVKITDQANDVYGAWRTGTHDDLVLAVALAVWTAKNTMISQPVEPFGTTTGYSY